MELYIPALSRYNATMRARRTTVADGPLYLNGGLLGQAPPKQAAACPSPVPARGIVHAYFDWCEAMGIFGRERKDVENMRRYQAWRRGTAYLAPGEERFPVIVTTAVRIG